MRGDGQPVEHGAQINKKRVVGRTYESSCVASDDGGSRHPAVGRVLYVAVGVANLDFSISLNPRSCVASVTIPQTGEIVGGTGQFTAATGSFTGTVTASAVLARNPDGSCSDSQVPLHEVDMITSTGSLSF